MMRLVRKAQLQSLTPGACVDAILEEMFRPGDAITRAGGEHLVKSGYRGTDPDGVAQFTMTAMLQAVRAGK